MKFQITRLEERIAPTRGTLYNLVSGMNTMSVTAKDNVTPLRDGSVNVVNDNAGHMSVAAGSPSATFAGGLLPAGSLATSSDGTHQETVMSGHGGTMAAGMIGQGQIQMENYGHGNDHAIAISGDGGLFGGFLKGGSMVIDNDGHGHESIIFSDKAGRQVLVIDDTHAGFTLTGKGSKLVNMEIVNDGQGHQDVILHAANGATLMIHNDTDGRQDVLMTSTTGSVMLANADAGGQSMAMETTGKQAGMLLVDNETGGQAVLMSYQKDNQTGLAMIANYQGGTQELLVAGTNNAQAGLLMMINTLSGGQGLIAATTDKAGFQILSAAMSTAT
jgi:hypothetical protein